jgi:UTP--glucose-1-phosphate uridylyltransferase
MSGIPVMNHVDDSSLARSSYAARALHFLTSPIPSTYYRIMSRFDVRKAVIPAAGLGTRFLPATKASPKEMLPLVDKPLIQYAVEEAVASGIEDIIIITGRGKRAIEDHFDRSVELEENLKGSGKAQLLSQMRHISTLANFCYVRQTEALGLGHAVLCAQRLIGDEPFAVILGDEIIDAPVPGLAQLIHAYKKRHGAILGVQEVPHHEVNRYGIVSPRTIAAGLHRVEGLIEKPAANEAPSNLAVIGRYVLPPEIFSILRKTQPGKNGEIQLTDALRESAKKSPMYALEIQGQRYDAGDKLGFLVATVEFALKNPSLGQDFRDYLLSRMRPSGGRRTTRSRKV